MENTISVEDTVTGQAGYMIGDTVVGVQKIIDLYSGTEFPAGWIGTIQNQRDIPHRPRYFVEGKTQDNSHTFHMWINENTFRLRRRVGS